MLLDKNYKEGDLIYKCTYKHVSGDIVVYRLRGREFTTIKFKRGNEFIDDIDKFSKALGFNSGMSLAQDKYVSNKINILREKFNVLFWYSLNLTEIEQGIRIGF